ncbi:MAG: MGMT family protein [Deltaproteobacteria bacterium]|nr:MGMT family protein [Deltaproteobacteria bacterium]
MDSLIALLLFILVLAFSAHRLTRPAPTTRVLLEDKVAHIHGQEGDMREKVKAVVEAIPPGRVLPLAVVGELAGEKDTFKVIRVMRQLAADPAVPWWRVVKGTAGSGHMAAYADPARQEALLAQEGVTVEGGAVALDVFRWEV